MRVKEGDTIIYNGNRYYDLIKGKSYIIEFTINDSDYNNLPHFYYHLENNSSNFYDSCEFITITENRKLKLQKIKNL